MLDKTLAGALCAVAALAIVACGGDDEASTSARTRRPASQPTASATASWSRNSTRLQRPVQQARRHACPTKAELAAAQLQILNENADLIAEIEPGLPDEIRDDFILSEQSARERAEAGDASVPPKEVADANLRLRKFRAELPAAARRLISRRARPAGREVERRGEHDNAVRVRGVVRPLLAGAVPVELDPFSSGSRR